MSADDYITKPFENKELVARVKAVLRRAPGEAEPASPAAKPEKDDTLRFPGLTVSLASYEVTYEGKPVEMPPKELEVLYYLASHPNMVFTSVHTRPLPAACSAQAWRFQSMPDNPLLSDTEIFVS